MYSWECILVAQSCIYWSEIVSYLFGNFWEYLQRARIADFQNFDSNKFSSSINGLFWRDITSKKKSKIKIPTNEHFGDTLRSRLVTIPDQSVHYLLKCISWVHFSLKQFKNSLLRKYSDRYFWKWSSIKWLQIAFYSNIILLKIP